MKITPEIIESTWVIFAGSTLSIIVDYLRNKKTTLIQVFFRYLAWSLTWYLTYRYGMDVWAVAVASILWADIIKYLVSEEIVESIKDIVKNIIIWKK